MAKLQQEQNQVNQCLAGEQFTVQYQKRKLTVFSQSGGQQMKAEIKYLLGRIQSMVFERKHLQIIILLCPNLTNISVI